MAERSWLGIHYRDGFTVQANRFLAKNYNGDWKWSLWKSLSRVSVYRCVIGRLKALCKWPIELAPTYKRNHCILNRCAWHYWYAVNSKSWSRNRTQEQTVKLSTILIINSVVLKHLTVQTIHKSPVTRFQLCKNSYPIQNLSQYKWENLNLLI